MRERFAEFYAAVNEGRYPFAWQQRLFDRVISEGWPDVISAPTGSGKSVVVDVHIFAVACRAVGEGHHVPRRLAIVVNRRGLVDQHDIHARHILSVLKDADSGVLAGVRAALVSLVDGVEVCGASTDPVVCLSLRGGVRPTHEWLSDPRACAVIAATPDMWGSRLLFRGYGASTSAMPREAGLLALDSVVVLDEAHLNRQLVATARSVGAMVRHDSAAVGVPPLAVVQMTATPDEGCDGDSVCGVDSSDIEGELRDRALSERLTRPKSLRLVQTAAWTAGRANDAYIAQLADEALAVRKRVGERVQDCTIAVVVNNVDTAVRVSARLKKSAQVSGDVVTLVGRLRPMDVAEISRRYPGLLTALGNREVSFLVTTQTIEVGVDLDVPGMVTELAPASALVQRAGRVNRRGLRPGSELVVLAPEAASVREKLPYAASDLAAALQWAVSVASMPGVISPWGLASGECPSVPGESLRRLVLSRLWPGDLDLLIMTSLPLFVNPDLTFWLRDDLDDDDATVNVIVRDLPTDPSSALALVKASPIIPEEVFACSIVTVRKLLELLYGRSPDAVIIRWRGEDADLITDRDDVRPGDQIVVSSAESVTQSGVVVGEPPALSEPIPVLYPFTTAAGAVERFPEPVVITADLDPAFLEEYTAAEDKTAVVAAHLVPDADVTESPELMVDDDGRLVWLVVRPKAHMAIDAELRQQYSSRRDVLLDQHQASVGDRARTFAAGLGLHEAVSKDVEYAGAHHDDGKVDVRFQREVLKSSSQLPLAKSNVRAAQIMRRRLASSTLPTGWRHESLSAAISHARDGDCSSDLALRLIGTSHGHGRPLFRHGSSSLLHPEALAGLRDATERLIDSDWAALVERTNRAYGPWGCALLEAVVRAADCSISAEESRADDDIFVAEEVK